MTDVPPPKLEFKTPPPAPPSAPATHVKQGKGCGFYGCLFAVLLLIAIVATAGITYWWMQRPVKEVKLSEQEEQVLANKVEYMTKAGEIRIQAVGEDGEPKTMDTRLEVDDEDFVRKRIVFTERELNALVNDWFTTNTDFQNNILITLRPDTVLGATTIDMPDIIPVIGGKSIRTKVKIYAGLDNGKLDIRVQNISLGGIPLKNSWTGGLIGQNLVDNMATDDQMKGLVDGIEEFGIKDGEIVFMPAGEEPVTEPSP